MFKPLLMFLLLSFFPLYSQYKVIIDTDPGIDDAVAILLAFQCPEIEVIGLSSTFGNHDIDVTTKNCQILLELAEKEIPIAKGFKGPLVIPKRPNPDFVHGQDGLGNLYLEPNQKEGNYEDADSFIIRSILENPKEITFIGLGPLTNLATALIKEPKIASLVKEVIVFAGAIYYPGNCNPLAEANVWSDPHAADIVFSSGLPLTTICLNASKKPQLTKQILNKIERANPKIGVFLNQINQFYIDFYLSQNPSLEGANIHDSLTIAYLLNKDLFSWVEGPICVVKEGIAEGATLMDISSSNEFSPWNERPKVRACIDCKEKEVVALMVERLSSTLCKSN